MEGKKRAPSMLAHAVGASPASCVDVVRSHSHLTQNDTRCQLSDNMSEFTEQEEIKERFGPKRSASQYLALVFDDLAAMDKEHELLYGKKYERVVRCGDFLQFAHEIGIDGTIGSKGKLFKAEFCRERLCPMCSWRRSLKVFGQVSQIMDMIANDCKFSMLTLTVPSVDGEHLASTIKRMMKAFNVLTRYKAFRGAVLGFFRALEVTRNEETGMYHPHFHIVLAVHQTYFSSNKYINQETWLQMWRKAYKDPSILIVDVRRVKGRASEGQYAQQDLKKAVAEVAKYSVKDVDYLIPDDLDKSSEIVDTLYRALHGVRLCHFGGIFRDAYKALQLQDAESEDANLVDIGEDKIREDVALLIVQYDWRIGTYVKGGHWKINPLKAKKAAV